MDAPKRNLIFISHFPFQLTPDTEILIETESIVKTDDFSFFDTGSKKVAATILKSNQQNSYSIQLRLNFFVPLEFAVRNQISSLHFSCQSPFPFLCWKLTVLKQTNYIETKFFVSNFTFITLGTDQNIARDMIPQP